MPPGWVGERVIGMNPFATMTAAGMSPGPWLGHPGDAVRAVGGDPRRRLPPRPGPADHGAVGLPGAHPRRLARCRRSTTAATSPRASRRASRSGPSATTPGHGTLTSACLPDLSPGATLPTSLRTVIRGRTVFDRGALP